MESRSVGEVNELVFAAALHGGYPLPFGTLCGRAWELPALRRVMGLQTRERLPFDRRSEARCGFVDFGEFGHRSNFASFAELNNASDGHGEREGTATAAADFAVTREYGKNQRGKLLSPRK